MNEIYWVTRLDALTVLFVFMIIVPVVCAIIDYFVHKVGELNIKIGWMKCRLVSFIIGVLGVVFIPSKSDMLLIMGVGGAVDYIKTNDTARQLPDKCIDALDAWVDNLKEENHH